MKEFNEISSFSGILLLFGKDQVSLLSSVVESNEGFTRVSFSKDNTIGSEKLLKEPKPGTYVAWVDGLQKEVIHTERELPNRVGNHKVFGYGHNIDLDWCLDKLSTLNQDSNHDKEVKLPYSNIVSSKVFNPQVLPFPFQACLGYVESTSLMLILASRKSKLSLWLVHWEDSIYLVWSSDYTLIPKLEALRNSKPSLNFIVFHLPIVDSMINLNTKHLLGKIKNFLYQNPSITTQNKKLSLLGYCSSVIKKKISPLGEL